MDTVFVLLVMLHWIASVGSTAYFMFRAGRTRSRFYVSLAIIICVQYVVTGLLLGAPAHTFAIWYLNIAVLIFIWWRMRPPRKRGRLRQKAKVKLRKIAVRLPRPLAPAPVGA